MCYSQVCHGEEEDNAASPATSSHSPRCQAQREGASAELGFLTAGFTLAQSMSSSSACVCVCVSEYLPPPENSP